MRRGKYHNVNKGSTDGYDGTGGSEKIWSQCRLWKSKGGVIYWDAYRYFFLNKLVY